MKVTLVFLTLTILVVQTVYADGKVTSSQSIEEEKGAKTVENNNNQQTVENHEQESNSNNGGEAENGNNIRNNEPESSSSNNESTGEVSNCGNIPEKNEEGSNSENDGNATNNSENNTNADNDDENENGSIFIDSGNNFDDSDEDIEISVSERVQDFYATVDSLDQQLASQLPNVKNKIKRSTLKELQSILWQIGLTSDDFQQTIQNVDDLINSVIPDEQSNIEAKWSNWASTLALRTANITNDDATKQAEIENTLNGFVGQNTRALDDCATQLEKSLAEYGAAVRDAIDRFANIMPALTDEVNACLSSDNSAISAFQCKRNNLIILRILRVAPINLKTLIYLGRRRTENGFENSICALNAQAAFETEKSGVLLRIYAILNRDD